MSAPFTYKHYKETITRYKQANYEVISFQEYISDSEKYDAGKFMILRHDIDLNMHSAFRMAQADHEVGVHSTFFIRIHADRYNPFSYENISYLNQIQDMGHEIGLHFEPGMAFEFSKDPYSYANDQKMIFEALIRKPFIGMSTHEPARADAPDFIENIFKEWGLKYHAYEDRFIKDIKYLSDSGGRWREQCFSNWVNKVDKLQVLVHPFWWYNKVTQENY